MPDQGTNRADTPENHARRKVIKKISLGVGVMVGSSVLPGKWTTPIVDRIVLPAHAITSGPATLGAVAGAMQSVEEYNTTEVYTLRSVPDNNKRFTWLNETGAVYGGQIKFAFSDNCGELVVPDAKVTYAADGNRNNHNQAYYFCGTDFPPGSRENNGSRASVFAPPGCPAATVTLYYNK